MNNEPKISDSNKSGLPLGEGLNEDSHDPFCPNIKCDCREYLNGTRHLPDCGEICLCPILKNVRRNERERIFEEIEDLATNKAIFRSRTSYDSKERRRTIQEPNPQEIIARLLEALKAELSENEDA